MALSNASLSTAVANIYVSNGNTVISTMYFTNTSASAVNLNVFLLPTGNVTANVLNQVYSQVQIAANDTFVVDWEKLVLNSGDQIRANASANTALNATISYTGI